MRHPILFTVYLIIVFGATIAGAVTTSYLLPLHGGISGLVITCVVAALMLTGGWLGDRLHVAD